MNLPFGENFSFKEHKEHTESYRVTVLVQRACPFFPVCLLSLIRPLQNSSTEDRDAGVLFSFVFVVAGLCSIFTVLLGNSFFSFPYDGCGRSLKYRFMPFLHLSVAFQYWLIFSSSLGLPIVSLCFLLLQFNSVQTGLQGILASTL